MRRKWLPTKVKIWMEFWRTYSEAEGEAEKALARISSAVLFVSGLEQRRMHCTSRSGSMTLQW